MLQSKIARNKLKEKYCSTLKHDNLKWTLDLSSVTNVDIKTGLTGSSLADNGTKNGLGTLAAVQQHRWKDVITISLSASSALMKLY